MLRFVDRVLQPGARNRFLSDLAPLARLVATYGHFNSLGQTLLKLTAPGVPDIYQGNELWDFSLVDPDNRRPVDYARRGALLKGLLAAERRTSKNKSKGNVKFAQELEQSWHDGRIKLFVIQRTLRFRRQHNDLFMGSDYIPLEVVGERAQHLCAYLRQNAQGQQVVVVVPRLVATLTERAERPPVGAELWGNTAIVLPTEVLPTETASTEDRERSYSNLFTNERCYAVIRGDKQVLPMAEVLGNFPVALLTTAQSNPS